MVDPPLGRGATLLQQRWDGASPPPAPRNGAAAGGGSTPPEKTAAAATVGWGVNPPYCVHDWLQGIASIFSALRAEIGMTGCWQGGSGYWMPAATVQLLWDSCRNSRTDRAGIQGVLNLLSESQSPDVPRGVKHESLKWFQKICARFFWHLYDELSQHAFVSTRVEDLMTAAKVQNKKTYGHFDDCLSRRMRIVSSFKAFCFYAGNPNKIHGVGGMKRQAGWHNWIQWFWTSLHNWFRNLLMPWHNWNQTFLVSLALQSDFLNGLGMIEFGHVQDIFA